MDTGRLAAVSDPFAELARYYDGIMEDINYDRWVLATSRLAEMMGTRRLRHLDVACGTGKLVKRLKVHGWSSIGTDISWGMVRTGMSSGALVPLAQANMTGLPFADESADIVTCLFDSVNFLLEPSLVEKAIREFARVLAPNGVLYFDIVTERMVTEHFENQKWTEDNGRFSTTWEGTYDRRRRIADTHIRVNTGVETFIRERVYPVEDIKRWVDFAGMDVLGILDAETWRSISRRTIRADVIAAKTPPRRYARPMKAVIADVRRALR